MATGKTPDPSRRKNRHPHATHLKVPCGGKEFGYVAGELYGCYTHYVGNAHPCLKDITDDCLPCQYCILKKPVEWRGYVPLWDVDWTLRYALIGEDYFESVNSIGYHKPVVLTRHKNPISPLVIREFEGDMRALPNKSPWNTCIYGLRLCLTLWQDEDLTKWCQEHATLALGASPGQIKAIASPAYTAPTLKDDAEPLAASMNRVMGKIKALPSSNGHAKPKG